MLILLGGAAALPFDPQRPDAGTGGAMAIDDEQQIRAGPVKQRVKSLGGTGCASADSPNPLPRFPASAKASITS